LPSRRTGPVEHFFGNLILSMDKKAMRSERLRSGAPLLLEHDRHDQIGVVETHSIGSDGAARATLFDFEIRSWTRDLPGRPGRNSPKGVGRLFGSQRWSFEEKKGGYADVSIERLGAI
jgi:hypothetical protein